MRNLIRLLPTALAFFVVTTHPEAVKQQTTKTESDKASTTAEQQTKVDQQQRNRQSTFNPQRVTDAELHKTVNEVNKASSFMGMAVQNMQDEKLGSVKDLVFDPETGKISYAVLSVGGFLGVGDKLIAVPLKSLRAQPGEKYLVLNMTRAELSSAPGLANNNWPRLNDPALGAPASTEQESATSTKISNSTSASGSKAESSSDRSAATKSSSTSTSTEKRESATDKTDEPAEVRKQSSDQLSSPSSPATTAASSKDAQGSSPATVGGSSTSDQPKSDASSAEEKEKSSSTQTEIK